MRNNLSMINGKNEVHHVDSPYPLSARTNNIGWLTCKMASYKKYIKNTSSDRTLPKPHENEKW